MQNYLISDSRYHHTCAKVGSNRVLVIGGWDLVSSATTEFLDLDTLTWSPGPDVPNSFQLSEAQTIEYKVGYGGLRSNNLHQSMVLASLQQRAEKRKLIRK